MIWTGRADEAVALGLLLDRTWADAAFAAAHPRLLDREFLVGQFDLWADQLLPAVHAGTAPPWTRRSAARAVWHRLGAAAGAGHRRWMAGHLDGLGLDPGALLGTEETGQPPGSGGYDSGSLPGGVGLLATLQLMIMARLGLMRSADRLRRWELAAAASLCGGLNAELFRVRPAVLRTRWADRRLGTILATGDARAYALLRQVARPGLLEVPERPGAVAPPGPVRITVGSARRLLDELDFTGARLRFVDVAAHRTVVHLDVRRGDRETIVVAVLTELLDPAPVTVPPDGLALTGRPTLEATADDICLTLPLPGGDWNPRATAGSWYVD
jgi:hypothetical protein